MDRYEECRHSLKDIMRNLAGQDILVAFSGGVDSSLLLKMACEEAKLSQKKVYAVMLHTMLHPSGEVKSARETAEETGAEFIVLEIDELQNAGISDNPPDRCYLCKKYLFSELKKKAAKLSVPVIIEGTNADDLHVYRPGIMAVQELGILSPLADAQMTKEDVRKMAAEYGMKVSKKASVPCLATRFPYGTVLSYDEMLKVDSGERYLKKIGFYNVRLRVYGSLVRIEVDLHELSKVLEARAEIMAYLKELGYTYVTVDLEGFRSGSMDCELDVN